MENYRGSTFQEVRDLAFSDPYDVYPNRTASLRTMIKGFKNVLLRDNRTLIADEADVVPHFDKLAHPTGICLTGTWKITEDNDYTGVFRTGTEALIVVRCSTVIGRSRRDESTHRGFGFAGKIFPTTDPDERVETVNFTLIDTLLGTTAYRFTDEPLSNEPAVGVNPSIVKYMAALINVVITFRIADTNIVHRPLYPLGEVGSPDLESARTPHWMQVEHDPSNGQSDESDIRDELDVANYESGVLRYRISVAPQDRKGERAYTPIGEIALDESCVADGGDHRIRFRHYPNRRLDEGSSTA